MKTVLSRSGLSCLLFLVPLGLAAQAPVLGADRITREVLFDGTSEVVGFLGWVTMSPGGYTVISNPQEGQLCFLDHQGKLIIKRGRLGAGPGEVRVLGEHGWTGDTLWVHDSKLGRITLYSEKGDYIGSTPSPSRITLAGSKPGATGVALPSLLGRHAGAGFLIRAGRAQSGPPQEWLGTISPASNPVFLASRTGAIEKIVGGVPDAGCTVALRVGNNSAAMVTPYCDPVQLAVSPNGKELAVVVAPVTGQGAGRLTVERWRHPGWARTQSQHPVTLVRVDPTTRDSLRTTYIRRAPNAEFAAAARTQLEIPTIYSAFRKAVLGDDQTLWLERWPTGKEGIWWELSSGGVTRAVTLPRSFRGYVGGKGFLAGIEADADGIESVVRYRVR